MTKKQYQKKVRQLQRNIARYAKANGGGKITNADRVTVPIWGAVIWTGKHEGEILSSYDQCWDMISEILKNTNLLDDIN